MKKLFKNRFVKNTGWILAGKIIQMVLSLVVNMLVARYLGPNKYGTLNYVNSYVAFFTTFCNLGLNYIIIKELISKPEEEGKILGSAMYMRLFASMISMIVLLAIIYFSNNRDNYLVLIALLQSFALLFAAVDVILYWYQSKMLSQRTTFASVIAYVIMSAYKIILIIFKKELIWFALSISLDALCISFILFVFYKKDKGQKFIFSITVAKRMLKQSWHFIISGLMVTIYTQIDKIMLGKMLDFNSVGLYSIAILISGLWLFFPVSIIDSARPLILEAREKGSYDLYIKRLKQLYAVVIYSSLAYGIFVTIFSNPIILLLYGKEYYGAKPALIISVWYCAFSLSGSVNNIYLLSEGKSKFVQLISIFGALINILLNYLMIPKWGISGAAFATLLTQIFANLIMPLFFKDTRPLIKYIFEAVFLKGVFNVKK